MICEIICVDGFLCMSHLDIVHMLFAYLDGILILSEHIHIIHTLCAVVLDMFLLNTYHVQFSFRTLSTQNAHCQCDVDVVCICTHYREISLVDNICHLYVVHMLCAGGYVIKDHCT